LCTIPTRCSGTPNALDTSSRDAAETVSSRGSRRATRPCMRVKPYQRLSRARSRVVGAAAKARSRSTVIG
jgi:hypothetical protein